PLVGQRGGVGGPGVRAEQRGQVLKRRAGSPPPPPDAEQPGHLPLRRRADLPRPAGRGPGPPPGRGGADVKLRRPGRYQLALLLAGVLFLVLVASSALDYLSLDQIPNRGALLGLPAVEIGRAH